MPTVRSALIFLAVPGLLLGLAAPSPATTPRLNALGAAGDYVEDDTGYLRWYGALGDQDNAVTADFGHFNIYQGYHDEYANTLSGPALHWRHRLGETVGTLAAFWQAVDDDLPNGTLHRNYRADSYGLTYGRDLGPVQLGLAYQNSPNSDRVYPSHPAARYHRQRKSWGLGARADISSGAYWDLALTTEKVANDFEPRRGRSAGPGAPGRPVEHRRPRPAVPAPGTRRGPGPPGGIPARGPPHHGGKHEHLGAAGRHHRPPGLWPELLPRHRPPVHPVGRVGPRHHGLRPREPPLLRRLVHGLEQPGPAGRRGEPQPALADPAGGGVLQDDQGAGRAPQAGR